MRPIFSKRKCAAQKDLCAAIEALSAGAIAYVDDEGEPLGEKIVFALGRWTDAVNVPKHAAACHRDDREAKIRGLEASLGYTRQGG